jgi:serine/threonine-protein kinase
VGEQPLGECVHTGAGTLDARGILHAVGAWNEASCISRATQRALLMAEEHGYRRIALPAIGTGQGRVSLEGCADGMVSALRRHLALGGSRLADVCFVLTNQTTRDRFVEVARSILFDENAPNAHEDATDPFERVETAPTVLVASR